MQIVTENLFSYLIPDTTEEVKLIEHLSDVFVIKQNQFMKFRGKSKFKQNIIPLLVKLDLKSNQRKFYTGFLSEILRLLKEYSVTPKFNLPTIPEIQPEEVKGDHREYQLDAVIKVLAAGSGIIKGPVGAGKTYCMAMLVSALRSYRQIILVPGLELMEQVSKNLQTLTGLEIVPVRDMILDASDPQIVIGIPQHFQNVPDYFLARYKVLIMDEVHSAPAERTLKMIERQNAPFRFGFTATPTGRSDGRDKLIVGLFGDIIETTDYKSLVKENYSPEMRVQMHFFGWRENYNYIESQLIVFNGPRNDYLVQVVQNHLRTVDRPLVLILARRLDHIELLSKKYFPNAAVLTGETDDRSEIIKDIRAGKYQVVIGSNVMSQGIDIPEFTLGVNASGGKSAILAEQKSGRMARGKGVKQWIDIYDHYPNTLQRHAQERLQVYEEAYGGVEKINFPDDFSPRKY